MRRLAFLLLVCTAFSGCASRAERRALRGCSFTPRGTSRVTGNADSLRLSLAVEIHNPGTTVAVLDSFTALVSGSAPLATLSHGGIERVLPGTTDTVQIHLSLASASLMGTAALLALSPPDSLSVDGTAWIPGWFGTDAHHLQLKVPYSAVAGRLKGLFGGAFGQN